MPLADKEPLLKHNAFKTEKYNIDLLLEKESVTISILKYISKGVLLIATPVFSLALGQPAILVINIILALLFLCHLIYRIIFDSINRSVNLLKLSVLVAGGMLTAWLNYSTLLLAGFSLMTLLSYANSIALMLNISTFIAGFFIPGIIGIWQWLFNSDEFIDKQNCIFFVDRSQHVLLNKLWLHYRFKPFCSEEKFMTALNNALFYLEKKRFKLKNQWAGDIINLKKIENIEAIIAKTHQGDGLQKLISFFKLKAINRVAKHYAIQKVITYLSKSHLSTAEDHALTHFLNNATYLSPDQAKQSVKKELLLASLTRVSEKNQFRFEQFNKILIDFHNAGLEVKPLNINVSQHTTKLMLT